MNRKIKNWVIRSKKKLDYMSPVFEKWPENLFSKPYDDIIEYLLERFRTTESRTEYYYAMFYLTENVEPEELYVYFEHRGMENKEIFEIPESEIKELENDFEILGCN